MSRRQLENVVLMGRKDFLRKRERDQMAAKFYEEKAFGDLSRDTVGQYLGNKIANLTTPQLVTAVKYLQSNLNKESYEMMLNQCGIKWTVTNQLSLA